MSDCKHITIEPDVCHVWFGKRPPPRGHDSSGSEYSEYKTVLGDALIFDFDAEGRVVGIELLGNKPCQAQSRRS